MLYMLLLKQISATELYILWEDSNLQRCHQFLQSDHLPGMEWEAGVSRCKLLYIEWINNKVLLYSTGNYIQCPMINHNGKEY